LNLLAFDRDIAAAALRSGPEASNTMERFLRRSCVASLANGVEPTAGITANKHRARELGVPFEGDTGAANAITDVPGVLVGHETIVDGTGANAVRTGVTAVLPRGHRDSTCFAGM
jgi:hypothetical protein